MEEGTELKCIAKGVGVLEILFEPNKILFRDNFAMNFKNLNI